MTNATVPNLKTPRLPRRLPLDELKSVLRVVAANRRRLVTERNTIALVRDMDNFWPESRADELRASLLGERPQQLRHSCSVLRVEVGVDLVEDDEGAALCTL